MRRLLIVAAASVSLAFAGSPAVAQEGEEPSGEELSQMGEMFAGHFTSEPLTPEQEARVPAAMALMDIMMPQGFYVDMMNEMIGSTMAPMLEMMSGAQGAELVLGSRLNVDPEVIAGLSGEQKAEVAALLDPAFAQRGAVMQGLMNDIMVEAAILIEPGFREGMAKAYAIRFDDAQLEDIAAFFATPTGGLYARENIKLMADPQVMSASMQAMPAMMQQFGDLGMQLEEAMAALPAERGLADMNEEERARLAEMLGVDAAALDDIVAPVAEASEDSFEGE